MVGNDITLSLSSLTLALEDWGNNINLHIKTLRLYHTLSLSPCHCECEVEVWTSKNTIRWQNKDRHRWRRRRLFCWLCVCLYLHILWTVTRLLKSKSSRCSCSCSSFADSSSVYISIKQALLVVVTRQQPWYSSRPPEEGATVPWFSIYVVQLAIVSGQPPE